MKSVKINFEITWHLCFKLDFKSFFYFCIVDTFIGSIGSVMYSSPVVHNTTKSLQRMGQILMCCANFVVLRLVSVVLWRFHCVAT